MITAENLKDLKEDHFYLIECLGFGTYNPFFLGKYVRKVKTYKHRYLFLPLGTNLTIKDIKIRKRIWLGYNPDPDYLSTIRFQAMDTHKFVFAEESTLKEIFPEEFPYGLVGP